MSYKMKDRNLKKALIIATVGGFIASFELNDVKILQKLGYEVHGASNFKDMQSKVHQIKIHDSGMICHQIDFERSPFRRATVIAYMQLKKLLQEEDFELIHCHTPMGGVITRAAGRKARKQGRLKIIYTAHGFHFFKGAPVRNWLFYYPVEKWMSRYTDMLITINHEDYERAKEKLHAKKVRYIPGAGIDTGRFSNDGTKRQKLREEFGLPEDAFVLISVGELNVNKNFEVIIHAIAKVNCSRLYYVICGEGPLKQHLQDVADSLHVSDKVLLLGFRSDIEKMYQIADLFAFPSLREGLGLAALEAMASSLPLLTSDRHGIRDYSQNGVTGYTYNPKDIEGFSGGIKTLMKDAELRRRMGKYNRKTVKKYDIKNVGNIMENIYEEIIDEELYRV